MAIDPVERMLSTSYSRISAGDPLLRYVEHLVSRQATRFQSLEALLGFISRVLREVRDTHSTAES